MDKIKTLSQAIRYGSKLSEQVHGTVYRNGKTCALGAAVLALRTARGKTMEPMGTAEAVSEVRHLATMYAMYQSPATTNSVGPLANIITGLNDRHEWSREQIADWLETAKPL